MNCAACGHENRSGAKFCEECASPLSRVCAQCGAELRPTAKFCDECATPTGRAPRAATPTGPASPSETRKVVTIVFADLVGSTALHERLDAESARRFMESYYAAMRAAVDAHGGTVTQLLGDGVKAVFGIPRVAEDDAIRAVHAAVAMQEAFRALAEQQRGAVGATGLRVAVNTGEVVANDADEIIGDPVNVAARLQERGGDGDVVVGETTRRLVGTLVTLELLGSFALKGRSEEVKAYRVVSLEAPAGAATAPFVGRTEELARLSSVYETAVAKPAVGLAVLVGSPGLGKSRLIDEFALRSQRAATVVRAHCDAAGGATFAPLATGLREYLEIEADASADALRAAIEDALPAADPDRARIAQGISALLTGSPASAEETFFVVRRLLASLASTRPAVLVIDDLQWAEPLLLDLIEHLVQWGSGVPLMVLIGARPELRDLRSSLVTPGGLVADVLTLTGLDAGAAMRLAANVIGASDLPAAAAAKVLAASEGNPLFVGELVRMLVQEGALTRDGERWTVGANLASLEMPPTIHALLAARIERLRPEDRAVLERAAVVGRHFSRGAVAELLPQGSPDLDARLESLRRAELIERDSGWFLGEPGLRFHHLLIRDAAYRRLLKGTRAELHARFADWVEARAAGAAEHDETLGWHLEQAHQHLRELGPIDERGRLLGERAAKHLSAAGRRALTRDDVPLAASLLGRALDRIDSDAPERADLLLDHCEALLSAGDVAVAATAIEEFGRLSTGSERLSAWHTCFAGQLSALIEPQALNAVALSVAGAAEQLASQGDSAGEAKAHFVYAQVLARLGSVGKAEAALDRALAAARKGNDRRRANAVLAGAPLAALSGPSPVTRASGRCLDVVRVLRITQGAPGVEAVALSCQGLLEALRGRTEAARRMLASSRKMVEELGITHRLLEVDVFAGRVELLEGDVAAAEHSLRGAYEGLRDLGLGIDAARAGALLGRALLAQDNAAEAEALSHESEALAGDDLQAAIAWRGVRAEALARRGEHAAAIQLAKAAVAIASATDALLDHADARVALAAALRAAGRSEEAQAEERRAIELWEAKGATLLVENARRGEGRSTPTPIASVQHSPHTDRSHRIRANAATRWAEHWTAAIEAADIAAMQALQSDELHVTDHWTGSSYGGSEVLAGYRSIERATNVRHVQQVLATLGESLVLARRFVAHEGMESKSLGSFGPVEIDRLVVTLVDENGRSHRTDLFEGARLGQAIERLYERYAETLPEGPDRERAVRATRSFSPFLHGTLDFERMSEVVAPEFESVDHRTLSTWSARGRDAVIAQFRALDDVASDSDPGVCDVLALGPSAFLDRRIHSGVDRRSGGAFERELLSLLVTRDDGLLVRVEMFDADCEAEALARFDALTQAAPIAGSASARRVRKNACTEMQLRVDAAIAKRDFASLAEKVSEDYVEIDHPTGATYGAESAIASVERFMGSRDPHFRTEPLATLGNSLGLFRRSASATGGGRDRFDVGDYENERIAVIEVDDRGRMHRQEVFAAEHLDDAFARLYERYAEGLPDGPERERAVGMPVALRAFSNLPDLDRLAAAIESEIEIIDHRTLSTWSARGADATIEHYRALTEVASDITAPIEDVLAAEPHAVIHRRMHSGINRQSGGHYERVLLTLCVLGASGRAERIEFFDPDREAEALARFDELLGGGAPRPVRRRVRANEASVLAERFERVFAAGDTGAIDALWSDALEVVDHQNAANYGRDGHVDSLRRLRRARRPTLRVIVLATLGETLALCRRDISAVGTSGGRFDVGEWGRESFVLFETAGAEQFRRIDVFSTEYLGDAVRRLHERYAELLPDGPKRVRAKAIARAPRPPFPEAELEAALDPAAEMIDHRLVGPGLLRGRKEIIRALAALADLTEGRSGHTGDVLALTPDGSVLRITSQGSLRDGGGAFERELLVLRVFGDDGLITHWEVFDADREGEALARFDELLGAVESPAHEPFANAATRAIDARLGCFNARDWPGIEACIHSGVVFEDRRRMQHLTLNADDYLAHFRFLFDVPDSRFEWRTLATRGECLALSRGQFLGSVEDGGGPLAFDADLSLNEVDSQGRLVSVVLFDHDAEDVALAELDARFEAGEGAAHPRTLAWVRNFEGALQRRDWEAVADCYAADFVGTNHRLVSWGSVSGRYGLIPAQRELVELAPDVRLRVDHMRTSQRALLWDLVWVGTHDGGPFESAVVSAVEIDEAGRALRTDLFDPQHRDRAFARFAQINASAPPDPLAALAKLNAASRWIARWTELFNARDFEQGGAMMRRDLRYEDRRPLFRFTGDWELAQASMRERADAGARCQQSLLGTAGDRIALSRLLWSGGGEEGRFESETLTLIEVDAAGSLVVVIHFDPSDGRAARREAWARWGAIDPRSTPVTRVLGEQEDAFNAHDPVPYRAVFADDLIVEDHRRTGMGRIEGADAYIETLVVLWELAPETTVTGGRFWYAIAAHGAVTDVRRTGRVSGGGEFESDYLHLCVVERGLVTRVELFEVDDLERALERLEQLRPDPLRVPENAATQLLAEFGSLRSTGQVEALREFASEDFVFEDRGRRSLVRGGVEEWLRALSFLVRENGAEAERRLLATGGDSIALQHVVWRSPEDPQKFELENFLLCEVSASGKLRALVVFDDESRAAASAELLERYCANSGLGSAAADYMRAWNDHDLERLSALMPDFFDDHRRTGVGRLAREPYVESLRSFFELSPDVRIEPLYEVAAADQSRLLVNRWFGTDAEGGEFEAVYVALIQIDGERIAGLELFELEDLEVAKARFDEVGASTDS